MIAVLLGLADACRPRARWRHHLLGALVALITFLIVGAPMLYYAAHAPAAVPRPRREPRRQQRRRPGRQRSRRRC